MYSLPKYLHPSGQPQHMSIQTMMTYPQSQWGSYPGQQRVFRGRVQTFGQCIDLKKLVSTLWSKGPGGHAPLRQFSPNLKSTFQLIPSSRASRPIVPRALVGSGLIARISCPAGGARGLRIIRTRTRPYSARYKAFQSYINATARDSLVLIHIKFIDVSV